MNNATVNIVLEYRFYIDDTGQVFTDASFDYLFWQRYLMVFGNVNIIARAKSVNETSPTWKKVTGKNVSFSVIPYYHGFADLLKRAPSVIKQVRRLAATNSGHYIFRMPSIIGALFFMANKEIGKQSFGVEMVGDPEEVFESLSSFYKPIGRIFVRNTRSIIRRAKAVAYVERVILPKKYPGNKSANAYYFSSINLQDASIASTPRQWGHDKKAINIVSIGSLDQMYKGPDLLLKALAICKEKGLNFELNWIGGGVYQEKMSELATNLGIAEHVHFRGMIAGKELIEKELDASDIFVLASRTEGLPRAMIEAMARGLPCIGANVGGIPELLNADNLFEKENYRQLAELIIERVSDISGLTAMSAQNIETARRYLNSRLDKERVGFYSNVLKAS